MTDADARPTPMTEDARTARVDDAQQAEKWMKQCQEDAVSVVHGGSGVALKSVHALLTEIAAALRTAREARDEYRLALALCANELAVAEAALRPSAQGDGDPAGDEPPVEDQAP